MDIKKVKALPDLIAKTNPQQLKADIRQIVLSRDWYSDPFNLDTSLTNLSTSLNRLPGVHVTKGQLERISTSVFKGKMVQVGRTPLAEWLNRQGYRWLVWSQGESDWQVFKARQAGLFSYLSHDRFLIFESDKPAKLVSDPRFDAFLVRFTPSQVVAVDDKMSQLESLKSHWARGKLRGLKLDTFNFDPLDPEASAVKLTSYLKSQILAPSKIMLLMDFDNVLVLTYKILSSDFCDQITDLVCSLNNSGD